jgi:D-3-phosphoglycerate dehydrogenase
MKIIAYDPAAPDDPNLRQVQRAQWPDRLGEVDFIVIGCALTKSSYQMINDETLAKSRTGVRIVNVGRGPIIDEKALERALESGKGISAA